MRNWYCLGKFQQSSPLRIFCLVWLLVGMGWFGILPAQYQNYRQTTIPRLSAGAWFHKMKEAGKIPPYHGISAPTAIEGLEMPLMPLVTSPNMIGPFTKGVDYDINATINGTASVPPDPTVAVGPSHVMPIVNVVVEWYTKARTLQYRAHLDTFFSPNGPQFGLFDPWIVYDQYANRYVVMAVEESDNQQKAYLHIAVSDDNDPNGVWYYLKWDAVVLFGSTKTWPDYPKLGVGPNALYVTGNMFDFSGGFHGTRLWIIDKGLGTGGLYDGGTTTPQIYDPSTMAGLSSQAFTLVPAHMYGTPSGTIDNYMFSTEWDDGQGNNDLIGIFRVEDPLGNAGGPTITVKFVNPGEIHNNSAGVPTAPQLGDSDTRHNIEAGDDRAMFCVWWNDKFWGTFTTNPSSGTEAGQATAFWFRVNTSNWNSPTIEAQGYVDGEDIAASTYTFYPAIFPNQDGNAVIEFSASGVNIYPGAYYALIKNDVLQPSEVLKAGEDSYWRTFLGNFARNRWGDYNGASLDPTDNLTFWLFGEYALPRGDIDPITGEYGRWAVGYAHIGTIESPQYFYADNITSTSLKLHWYGRSAEFKITQNGSTIYTGPDTTLMVSGLTANTTYQFVVTGKSSGENYFSADSIILSVTTPPSGGSTNPVDVASATPTYTAGSGTSEFNIKQSGVWLRFPSGVTTATRFTAYKKSGDPGIVGSLPSTVDRISKDRNWTVVSSAGSNVGTYNIRFDLTGVPGITNFNTLRILKRDNSSSPWQDVETDLGATVSYNNPYITVSGLTSLSDFAIGAQGADNPLPVLLSSFKAIAGNQSVLLQWVTQSEINNVGFILERSTHKTGPFQVIASYETYPELQGKGNHSQPATYEFVDRHVMNDSTYYYRLVDVDVSGWKTYHAIVSARPFASGADLNKTVGVAHEFKLHPAYPNPFNPQTTIRFSVPNGQGKQIALRIYNARGQLVRTLFQGSLAGGVYELVWDARDDWGRTVPSGVYFVQFQTPLLRQTQKILYMR